jgi:hypothetical protein
MAGSVKPHTKLINLFQTWKIKSDPCTTSSAAWTRPASTFNLRAKILHVYHGHISTLERRVILGLNVVALLHSASCLTFQVPEFSICPYKILFKVWYSYISIPVFPIQLVMPSINTVHDIITRIFIYGI